MDAQAICCTLVSCKCDSFKPGKLKRRQCENCKHGWVAHALSKLKLQHMYQSSQVEIVHSNVVFDICSLMLYGTQAVPVRLKILLDRLFSVLTQDEVVHILNALDWTLQDYIRGYVLQDVAGKVLDRWAIMTFEEEIATLQQFLRFGETKSIVELMALQDKEGQAVLVPSTRTSSDIRAFIERSAGLLTSSTTTPTSSTGAPIKAEKIGVAGGNNNNNNSSVHHFENFINSMAFMLPFQLLGSVPAPLLGSPPGALLLQQQQQQQPVEQSRHGHRGEEDHQARDVYLPLPRPRTDGSAIGSSSASFTSDLDRGGDNPAATDGLSITAVTKVEAEDFPASDNYSDGPSTPRTPSVSSDAAQMSPETKLRSMERPGGGVGLGGSAGSLKKGRVFCSACEKTFYDKGTLKIHYNAVHLKIKHKCTIEGCNMVFSSLRSRNRHSANPNPRLHMPMNRNNRDKDLRGGAGGLSADEGSEGERHSEYGAASAASPDSGSDGCRRTTPGYMVSHVEAGAKLHGNSFLGNGSSFHGNGSSFHGNSSSFPSMGHGGILFPNLKTVQPVLPFYRSLVTPAELANTPGTLPSLPLLSSSVPLKPGGGAGGGGAEAAADPVPKKKSRKSSMPIKIQKEAVVEESRRGAGSAEDGGSSDDDDRVSPHATAGSYRDNWGLQGGTRQGGGEEDEGGEEEEEWAREKLCLGGKRRNEQSLADGEAGPPEDGEERKQPRRAAVVAAATITRSSSSPHFNLDHLAPRREPSGERGDEEEEEEKKEGAAVKFRRDLVWQDDGRMATNGDGVDGFDGSGSDLAAHHCELCGKTFKNPYSVKMHYRNVHLKEMHMCAVEGCNAAFPSRRSRDRHSANLNLHHKLLTKDTYGPGPAGSLYPLPAGCPGLDRRDTRGQPSVIFRGHNRMGLVFPMSKMADVPDRSEASPEDEMDRVAVEGDGGGVEDGAALDLSTSSLAALVCHSGGGSVHSSWDSDGGSSGEGDGPGEALEELPLEDSEDESCDGMGGAERAVGCDEDTTPGGDRTPGSAGVAEGPGGPQGGSGACIGSIGSNNNNNNNNNGGGSPITCHVCQKVYSNKGTFRAHYKTVHLRLLHKCKVPGCDTSFSSVRSRNRHSQNPNLHRNLAASSGAVAAPPDHE